MRGIARGIWAAAALMLAGCDSITPQPQEGIGTEADWPGVGGAPDEAGYSRLSQINTETVNRIGLAWSLDLPHEGILEATPLAVGGTLYFTGGRAVVYAVDGATGNLLWTFDPEVWKVHPEKMTLFFGVNRGMAYENGRLFFAALDGRLFALDAASGKQLWVVETLEPGNMKTSTGAPRVMNGKVIIGNGGGDYGERGYVTAYDQTSGKQLWRFYMTPGSPEENKGNPAMEMAARTWGPDHWKIAGGGGTVWNGMTYDPETNRIYIGTGNAGPYNPSTRDPGGGDNLFIASILALDADTGKYVWHYQENPREGWDYKASPNIVMATLNLDGKPRKVLLHAPTNGFFYVLDRDTGKLISAKKATLVTWAKSIDLKTGRPIEEPDIRYRKGGFDMYPGMIGGHDWQAMSYSPKTGLAYVPMQQIGVRFGGSSTSEEAMNMGDLTIEPVANRPGDGKGTLVAWDPVRQRPAWKVQHSELWNGGTLATAGGLVFQGAADGYFYVYDAANGRELWKFNAGHGIVAAPMSYSLGGRQYVSVLSGYGGAIGMFGRLINPGWKWGAQPRRLLTFALDGKASIPPSAPPDKQVHPIDDPSMKLDPADVAAGGRVALRCMICHGGRMVANGSTGPDLRESHIALQVDSLTQVLRQGALAQYGMPRFDKLSDTEIRQIHAYIRAEARKAKEAQPKS
ncbi:MAG: PQQ-dependent dehydrogenase, methanol/ethanol family [Novosphingobium sp.]